MPGFTLRMVAALACVVLTLLGTTGAAAQALDPEQQRARAMLENLCGRCHAVGKTGKSPNRSPRHSVGSAKSSTIPTWCSGCRTG
jgi:cytochrome c553